MEDGYLFIPKVIDDTFAVNVRGRPLRFLAGTPFDFKFVTLILHVHKRDEGVFVSRDL